MELYIEPGPGDAFTIRARTDGEGGLIGEFVEELHPGDPDLFGVTYEDVKKHGPGVMVISDE